MVYSFYFFFYFLFFIVFFFQAEDGIRDLVRSRGLGDVYKRQPPPASSGPPHTSARSLRPSSCPPTRAAPAASSGPGRVHPGPSSPPLPGARRPSCLLYTSDAADERSSVDLGGRRIIQKKNKKKKEKRKKKKKKKEKKKYKDIHIRIQRTNSTETR